MDVFGGAPRFFAYPRPVVVQSGADAVLKCQIGGDPRPAVIWERNNEKIDPQERYRVFEDGNVYNLIISAVTKEDSGQYICKAKNSIGETYAAATLNVEGEAQEMEVREENKPRFLIKPLSTRAGRGDDAVFSCKLWGNPRPEVVWEKDGKKLNEIFESTHFSVGFQDGGWFQLKIFKTRAPDGGVYTCKARNEFGEALAGAVLLVDAGPAHEDEANRNGYTNGHWKAHQGKQRSGRQVLNRLKDDTMSTKVKMFAVTEGKHAKFRCFVTGKPKPEIIWRKDGRLILSGRRYLLYEDREGYFTLKVLYCKQKDNGVYVCAASNTAGQTLSAVHLSVKEPPVRFKQPLIDLEVWERDLAVLECEVPEDSVPITWYLEDRRLQPGAKYGMEEWGTKRRLTIRDIGVDDDGIYLCEMPDGGRSIAEVAVKGTILRKLPRKVDVLEGENAAFCVEVDKEEMDIHWYKDAVELRETHQTILKSFGRTHILVFVNTNPQDSGLVTFLVGRSKTSSQLRVKAARHCPPSCPVSVQINTERANAALLSWSPAQDTRKNPPSGYVLERQEVGTGSQEWLQCLTTDSATSVEILGDSVPCEADYRFRICSVNKYGKSNNVEFPKAVHLVPVARIQAPLQDALVPEGQDALFSIELSASVIGTWFLSGTQLQEDERYSMRRSRTHQSLRIRGVRDTDNGAEITFIAYSIRDSAALYIQAPLVKFSPMSEMDRNKFVEMGNPIVLYCELSDPAAPVHWYKNGVEIQTLEGLHIQSEGTMRRIVIQSAEFSHSGVYCCDAIDDVIRFNVEVEAPPVRFSAIPDAERSQTIETGYPIVLCCELSDPSAQVHWYKDGSKLHPQTGVDIQTDGLARKLIVHSAEFFHSGLYCCKTKGDTVTFSVDIKAPPVKFSAIPEEMRTKSIEAGCPIVLQCVVSDPEAHVCWYKDETQLISNSGLEIHSEGDTRTLVVQSAELCHSGVYRCSTQDDTMEFQVEIKAIAVTCSTVFDVERTKSLEEGKPLELECEVADSTAPVCWYKDGVKLSPQNDWDIQSNGTLRRLIIPAAELLHSGLYSCETSDDTIHFTVDIKAPTLPLLLLPSPEVVETHSHEATCPPEPTYETSNPASQVSLQRDKEHDSNKEPNLEMGGIKKTLIIEPTSNSGAYYCATADDVAQLIINNQAPPPAYLLGPDEKSESAETDCQIVQQFEISDPIAKACWYKDGTQIYPKMEADCESQGGSQTVPFQSHDLPGDGRFGCEPSGDAQLNVDMKEQCRYGHEIGEIAEASAQYAVDVEATSPRLSSDQEQKSTEEACPVEVDWMSSKCSSGTFCGNRGDTHTDEEHSRPMPTYEYMADQTTTKPTKELSDNQQTTNAQSPVYSNSVKPTVIQSDTQHRTNKPTESQGEELIYYLQHEKAPPEELDNSLQTDEFCTFLQTAAFESDESALKTLMAQSEKLRNSLQMPTVQSELDNPLHTLTAQSQHLNNHLQISTVKSNKFCNSLKTASLQSRDPFKSSHTATVQSDVSFKATHTTSVQSEKPFNFSHTAIVQSEELCSSIPMPAVLSKKPLDCLQTETFRSEGPCDSFRIATAQSEEPFNASQTETVQSEEPFTFSHTATVHSEKLCSSIPMPAVLSKKLLDCLQTETFHSEGPCNSFGIGTAQSEEPSKSSQTSTVKSGEPFKSSHSETVQSEEPFKAVQAATLQSVEPFKSLKTAIVQSEELCSSTQMPAVLSEERLDCLQTEIVHSEGSCNSLWAATDQSVEFNRNQQTSTAHSEKLSDLRNTVYPQSLDSKDTGMVQPRKHYNLRQLLHARVDDVYHTGQTVHHQAELLSQSKQAKPGHAECHHTMKASEDQLDSTVNTGQRSSTQCAEPHYIKQASTVQSEDIYLSRTCDSHWSDSVTANKVAVEASPAPPVRITTLCEAERNNAVEVDEPIVLRCEISDPNAQVNWYKDGINLREAAGQDMLAEGSIRTLAFQSAMPSHAGIYSCNTTDDAMQFHVDVEAPLLKFSALSEGDQQKTVMAGFPIALQCKLSEPTGQVSWYKDGTKLLPQNRVDIQSEGSLRSLVVPSAEQAHSGVYRCESKDDDIQFAVEVKALPVKFSELQESDKSKSVQEGSPIVLSCELSHDRSAYVDWYKDGLKLLPQNNVEIQSDGLTRTLLIHSAENKDGGTYECSTSDDTITFKLDVEGRLPQIMPIPLSEKYKMVAMGCPIILQCEVSDPVAQVSWFKDEVELFSKTGLDMKRDGSLRKLMIHSAKVSDSGLYSCSLADDVVTFHVDVEASPVRFSALPEIARNKFVEASCPIKLQCEVSEQTAQVYWHKDGEQLLPKCQYELQAKEKLRPLVITSAEVRHSGVYSCDAADDHIEYKVDVAAVTEAERSKSVEAGSLINLKCEIADHTGHTSGCEDGIKLSQKLGTNIDSEGNKRTLAMKSATSSSSGVYSCKTNDDSDFNDFYVEVKAPPVTFADTREEDLFKSVAEREQFVLSCEVSRADGIVQWYKDGTEMQPCNNITMQAEGTKRNLTVDSAQLSNTGTYTCRAGDNILMYKVNIREPPVLIIYPKEDVHLDRHVPEEIILSCELSRPNGLASWFKDGQKLQESENIKLKIEGPYRRLKIVSSGVEDSGEYVCDTADTSIFFHLSITEPPVQIVSPSQSQMELCQQASERMVLSCEISRPNAVVRWYRDGLEVEENGNLILEVDGVYRRLIIPETTVKDSAEYVCDTADDSMTFFVNIAEPPVRFVRLRKMAGRVDKVAGDTLVLDCEVSRSNAEVTWKKNGEEVEDSRNITILEDGVMRQLTVHSLTMEDAGQYVCDAKDDVMDFHVKVQELPVKILGKTDAKTEKQFLVSDDIILVCELSRSNASVSWYKDNQLIDDTERYCSEEQGVFRSLVVLNAGLEDSGEYTCDAVDDKMVFYITVKEPQVQIIGNSGHPEHHILVAGDDLILECEVSRPNATVQWLWNGEVLKPDTRIKINSYELVRKLVVSGLRPSDSGKYICDAIDDKLTTIVEVQESTVKFENKKTSNNLSAYENESVTMCTIVSRERANIRWLKDGQLLNGDNIHISSEGNTHKLTINPLQLSDSGEYVCDVKTDEMYFSLLVKEMKAKFIRPLENIVSLKGSSLILRCEINKPKGDVQWLKDGQEISPSRQHTIRAQGRERSFTIHQLVEEDAGEYACESTDDRTSASVTVETLRVVEFIADLRNITVCEGEDAVFKCVVSPEDTRLVWRLNGKQVALTKRTVISSNGLCHMLYIHNCMVSDSGRVTADAEGSVSEAELQIQEQQVFFTNKMTPVEAEEYSEATLEVEVSLDSGEVQWMRQGVLIHPGAKNTLKHNGRKHSLTIHKLAMSDRGTYSCETLHDRTQAQLTVEPRKITIKRRLTDIKITERETASFEVELSHPNVPGTWMRNAIKLKATNHFRMSAKGQVHSLTISNLSVEDTGSFTFCVENLKTSARLVVKEPPLTIFRKLEDQKFPEGAVISLECELSRHNVDVKWMKNGVEVKRGKDLRIYSMGRKRFLQILKCNVSDSGIYTCDAGDVTTSCTVEVYERELLILQGPKGLDIQEDQNAVFVCELSVENMPGEWYKNGERIQPTSTIKIRQEGTKHFLLMCNVKAEDSGEIKFVSRHIESVAYLEVEELPLNIVKPLQDTTALEKSRVLLDCTVSNPRCSIRWYKGSNVILPSERFEICSEGCYRKLILQQVVLDDEGTYSVQVGEYSCSAKLTVEAQSPLMVRELRDVEVVAPDEACFECEVSVPVLKAPVWSLNGEPLQPSSRVLLEKMGTVHRLTLRQTSPDMSGEVEFTSGKAKSRAQLRVRSDP
ncbi:titin isoform X2 [Anarrhichthys ocellatus]|uniref:titin isoform X2 n=1 Tax=Anarrhichthys ocellatus TaxID=433405 RepID=UPI0012ED248A|nr:titin-like isoform X2 [Anarrhichthys ocellatus]